MEIQRVSISVFCPPEEDNEATRQALKELLAPALREKQGAITAQKAVGFNERAITILEAVSEKRKDVREEAAYLLCLLSEKQRQLLAAQAETRLDENLSFFLRLDKAQWVAERKAAIVEHGDCFHITISLVTFPKNRQAAKEAMVALLSEKAKDI